MNPTSQEVLYQQLAPLTYNHLMEKIVTGHDSAAGSSGMGTDADLLRHFVETTATQLTFTGIIKLTEGLAEGELAVLFRNAHFATVIKREGLLYMRLTDQGFRDVAATWQPITGIVDDEVLVDDRFQLFELSSRPSPSVRVTAGYNAVSMTSASPSLVAVPAELPQTCTLGIVPDSMRTNRGRPTGAFVRFKQSPLPTLVATVPGGDTPLALTAEEHAWLAQDPATAVALSYGFPPL